MSNSSRRARLELAIIGVVALTLAILELYIETLERLVVWAAQNESLLITEILTLAIVLSTGLSIYAWRRWREAVRLEADKVRLQQTVTVEQDANRMMRSFADAVMMGQEAERRRLARELHDDTIQRLIVLNQQVELATFHNETPAVTSRLREMSELIDDMVAYLRRFIQQLRPSYLDELGLVPALGALVKETRERSELLVELDVLGSTRRVDEATELALYRIAQAALSNVVRHAEASTVSVRLQYAPDRLLLSVEDDGIGFDVGDERRFVEDGHFGIVGMRERAQLLGADFRLESEHALGTKLNVVMPLAVE